MKNILKRISSPTLGSVCLSIAGLSVNSTVVDAQSKDPQKPNIIFILADDLGYAEIGCYGSDNYKTPNIDKLASQGIRFTNAYANPLSGPSRAVLLSGRYNFRTGATNQDACTDIFSPNEKLIPAFIKQAGYVSTAIGKWGQLPLDPSNFGFDDYLRYNGSGVYWKTTENKSKYKVNGVELMLKDNEYMPDLMHNHLVDFMTKNKEKPFFAYYSLTHVHSDITKTPDSKEDSKNLYADNIAYMDKLVGKLRAELDNLNLSDNTILIFFSDNGTAGGHADLATIGGRKLSGKKGSMLEAGSLEPLIIYWPGVTPKGSVSNDLISSTDFIPTFAEIAGVELPKDIILDGQSFNAQLHGEKGNPRTSLFVQLANNYWVRSASYKLNQAGELFDMSKAPFEEILVTADTQNSEAIAARTSLQAELDRLNPKGGYIDKGDGTGRHANKAKKKEAEAKDKNKKKNKKSEGTPENEADDDWW
ncbi:MAG: sulfatase-like hydrolase/transferase [Tenuifilaceae bacterium]